MSKAFEVIYQAAKNATTAQLDVYKPDKTLDATQSGAMTQIGTTGRFYKSFDADAPGWSVQCSDNKNGSATKAYDKPLYDTHGIADLVADVQLDVAELHTLAETVDGKVDGLVTSVSEIDGKIDDLGSPPMIG